MEEPRVLIIVNKWWEVDPLLFCLLSDYARPVGQLGWPVLHDHPRPRRNPASPGVPAPAVPRAIFELSSACVEIWCISDILEHLPDEPRWQSSTERKAERLADVFASPKPSLVIAVGTAASGNQSSRNGSVVLGTKCFLHNSKPHGLNPHSDWQAGPFGSILGSSLAEEDFLTLTNLETPLRPRASIRLFSPPLYPAPQLQIMADYDAVACANLNVSDYNDYAVTDGETLEDFAKESGNALLGSLETTHGLIRALGPDRFMYVSGIVDRLIHFDDDVAPRPYAQNTIGAHNAGIVISWLLPRLSRISL
ncbi:MAG: hypothetical protein WCB27_05775 [Thermoguttaceae bacterium]